MYISYSDILSRVSEPPVWWLEGVPRYDKFKPEDVSIYAKEALLIHIRCQACAKDYDIGLFRSTHLQEKTFRQHLTSHRNLPLGDPPNACCEGTGMTSIGVEILEFWERGTDRRWKRVPEFERGLWIGPDEAIDNHKEAWHRIRMYESRKAESRPAWKVHKFTTIKKSLFDVLSQSGWLKRDNGGIALQDVPVINTRIRLLNMAIAGKISQKEFIALEKENQSQFKEYEERPTQEMQAWAAPLVAELESIKARILETGIPGYSAMSNTEQEEQYCPDLSMRLLTLAETGRITQEEYFQIRSMLIKWRWS